MNGLQHSLANGDMRKAVLFSGCRLVEDFRLFQADRESEELGSFCEAGCQALQGTFRMGNKGSVVGKKKVSKQLLKSLCVGLQSPEIEQTAVEAIADVDSIVTIKAFHGLLEHHTEENTEQSWCQVQPCFTPLAIGKGLERSLFNLTWLCWSSCSWMTILRIFGGQPRRYMISQRPFLLTVSNALVRSTNVT